MRASGGIRPPAHGGAYRPGAGQAACPLISQWVIRATWRPWKRAISSSLAEGSRALSGPAREAAPTRLVFRGGNLVDSIRGREAVRGYEALFDEVFG